MRVSFGGWFLGVPVGHYFKKQTTTTTYPTPTKKLDFVLAGYPKTGTLLLPTLQHTCLDPPQRNLLGKLVRNVLVDLSPLHFRIVGAAALRFEYLAR